MFNSEINKYPALFFLIIVASLLPEVSISHNTPLAALVSPSTWFWLVIAYGLPVLLIREVWQRYHLNIFALALFGLVYGVLNEGIIAKTLTQTAGDPAGSFIGYGTVAGLHLGWTTLIIIWHAFFSVMLPIALTHWLFPAVANKPLVGRKTLFLVGGLTALLYLTYFVDSEIPTLTSGTYFAFYFFASLFAITSALMIGRRLALPDKREPVAAGKILFGGLILPNLAFTFMFQAPLIGVPVWLSLSIAWAAFYLFLSYGHRRNWGAKTLAPFLLVASAGFSFLVGLAATEGLMGALIYLILALSFFVYHKLQSKRQLNTGF